MILEPANRTQSSDNIARMTTSPAETEDDVRVRQTLVLRTLGTRLSQGDQLLPADLMGRIAEELELRIDEEAVSSAWSGQDARTPLPWRGEAARASRRSRGRDVREIWILERVVQDLEKLDIATREEMSIEIDALAFDPLPRGAAGLHGRKDDHVSLRVGNRRLLYKVQPHSVIVVAITSLA
jgi:mRNA-degrading endonuclease RelE of RelBE toxin-antitoxin system